MRSRLELQTLLEDLLESTNVYYQPPENLKMEYPCIRYYKDDIRGDYADDMKYSIYDVYHIVVISKRPDHPVINKILQIPYSSFNRHYVSDELNHDVIKLYF